MKEAIHRVEGLHGPLTGQLDQCDREKEGSGCQDGEQSRLIGAELGLEDEVLWSADNVTIFNAFLTLRVIIEHHVISLWFLNSSWGWKGVGHLWPQLWGGRSRDLVGERGWGSLTINTGIKKRTAIQTRFHSHLQSRNFLEADQKADKWPGGLPLLYFLGRTDVGGPGGHRRTRTPGLCGCTANSRTPLTPSVSAAFAFPHKGGWAL